MVDLLGGLIFRETPVPSPRPPSSQQRAQLAAQSRAMARQYREIVARMPPLEELLLAGDFAALEHHLRELQDGRDAGELDESTLHFLWNVFYTAEPTYREPLNRWVAAYPRSGFARAARGEHWHQAGWKARGTAYASKTSEAQFAGMREAFARAAADFQRAIELEPHLLVPYQGMMEIGRSMRDYGTPTAWLQRALAIDPSSYRFRDAYMSSLLPRWGGSYREMRRFARESFAYADQNRYLYFLGGEEAVERARVQKRKKNWEAAIALYGEALAFGPHVGWYRQRAACQKRVERYAEAAADYGAAVPFALDPIDLWLLRARVYQTMGRTDAALAELNRAFRYDPEDSRSYEARARFYVARGDIASAAPDVDRALALDPDRASHWVYKGWFDLYKRLDFPSAQRALRRYTELRPDDADGWFWLTQALDQTEHPDTRAVIVRYLEVVDRDDPGQRDRVEFFEKLLAKGF